MIRELVISFMLAAAFCPMLIALWYRDIRYGLAAIVPNTLPILIICAVLMLGIGHLQFTSAIAMSIAFGIATDDTVHVLNRLNVVCQQGEDKPSLSGIIHDVGPALITTAVVLSVGLSAVLFSQLPTMRFFGLLCIAVFVLALIADLFLLPVIMAVLGLGDTNRDEIRPQPHLS